MAQRKIALVIGYGQSNERGTGVAPRRTAGSAITNTDTANNVRHTSVFGQANVSLTTTAPYVEPCSMFQKLSEHIALETGWCVEVVNTAKGGTAATDSWCGWDTANGRIKSQGDAGYDPSGYIAGFVNAVSAAVVQGYEVWTITAGHQQDIVNLNRTAAQVIPASVHIQQRALAAGASKVIVGKTPRWIGSPKASEWDAGGLIHQIADGVIASIPGAIAGADLSGNVDTQLCANDDFPYVHLNHAGVCWAAEKWLNAIKAAKLI
jgi:hypothetical protein